MTPTTQPTIIDHETGEIVPAQKNRAYYASTINGLVSGMVEAIIETGRLLIEAKDRLDHGEFIPMIEEDLPFGVGMAENFMRIARNEVLANSQHVANLPPAIGTLAEVARLPDPEIIARLESGDLNPETQRKDVIGWSKNNMAHVGHNSGENEWYTPPEYIEAARAVMGDIDLDPASSDIANEIVKATMYYTEESDGLSWDWEGRVWMNPPYAQPLITYFCDKLTTDLDKGFITEAITLTNNATETKWFRGMASRCAAVCHVTGRIRFIDADGNPGGAPLQGQMILYFGKNVEKFTDEFTQFGQVFYAATR